jgi:hypothetical protein
MIRLAVAAALVSLTDRGNRGAFRGKQQRCRQSHAGAGAGD